MHASTAFRPAYRPPAGLLPVACASAVAAALILPLTASAAELGPTGKPSSSWGLGVGAASTQKPYTGVDRENRLIPIVEYENRYVRLFGPVLEVKLPGLQIGDTQRLNFRLVGRYDLSGGYEPGDSRIFDGMSERKGGFWAGARAEWQHDLANVAAEITGDASGYSKGTQFTLGIDRNWRLGQRLILTPRVAAIWQDDKYVDYYYGVRPGESRAGRLAYRGASGIGTEASLRAVYLLDRNQSLLMNLSVTGLASEIKDSPLVERSTRNSVFAAYLYRFW